MPDELRVLFLGYGNDESRLGVPATGLRELDVHTKVMSYGEFKIEDIKDFDLVITRNPTERVAGLIREIDTSGITRWSDIDRPGCTAYQENAHGHLFVVPNPTVGEIVPGKHVVVGTGFNDRNPLWNVVPHSGKQKVIGWFGVNESEFRLIKDDVRKFLNTHPNWSIIIGGNMPVYTSLAYISETRKKFIPYVDYFVYPAVIATASLILAPYPDRPPYTCMDEISVVEYALKQIPYIATELEPFKGLSDGLFVKPGESWEHAMNFLAIDIERNNLDCIYGDYNASLREYRGISSIGYHWKKLLEENL